ncbi:MAG: hypothetical protein AVDCRST_MAG05-3416, partial [uncultured Rubrobacteraceae bacterium]
WLRSTCSSSGRWCSFSGYWSGPTGSSTCRTAPRKRKRI